MMGFIILVAIAFLFWLELQEWMLVRESPLVRLCKLLKIKNF